jgi:hypothetical protein
VGYQERRVEFFAKRAAPHLEPGERIQTGFVALTGFFIFTAPHTIVATDRAILILERGGVQRLSRDVRFGRPTGLYHKIQLDRAYKVHRQYYQELAAADEALREVQTRANLPESEEH